MPDNTNNDYNELAKLIYPSIEASGNVYYGQTRKLAIDELFNVNDGGFESNIKTVRSQTDDNEDGFEYISYFCWKFGPLNGRIRIIPCENDRFIFTFANFPELERLYNLDDTYITNQSTDPIVGTLFIRYKLLLNDNTVEYILNSGKFNSYEKIISLDTDNIRVYITDNCDPTNVDNRDIDDRNIFVKHENDAYYLFVKLCKCAEIPDLDTFDPEVPFCIENIGNVPVEIGLYNHSANTAVRKDCKISHDLELWQDYTLALTEDKKSASINKITLAKKGDRVYFKATFSGMPALSTAPYTHFIVLNESANTKIRAGGNITSLTLGASDAYKTEYLYVSSAYCYQYMFYGCTSLVQAPELPATVLSQRCYYNMFCDCTSLVQAPELPATALSQRCYASMFNGCSSLIQAPELPATTLADSCYEGMFYGCTSLVQAPELPATELNEYCYASMFSDCSNLIKTPELPATVLSQYCYQYMFSGCSSLIQAPELPATTLADSCYEGMFYRCTSLVQAPELPATDLASECYYSMFYGCSSLIQAPELPATVLSQGCYASMFSGCSSLIQAPELPATNLADSCYYYMFYGCNKLNYVKCSATDISATDCTTHWLGDVSATGDFYCPASTTWTSSADGIPTGWTRHGTDI